MDVYFAIVVLFFVILLMIVAFVWQKDRREQRNADQRRADEQQRREDRIAIWEEQKLVLMGNTEAKKIAIDASIKAKEIDNAKELDRMELELEDARSRDMAEKGAKGRTQRQINSDQDAAMMEILGGLMNEYIKPNSDKEAIKAEAIKVAGGNVVTLLRLLKKMGIDIKGLM